MTIKKWKLSLFKSNYSTCIALEWDILETMEKQFDYMQNMALFCLSFLLLEWIYHICDCPCESLYKCSTNAFAFEQLKTKEKAQVHSKRTNPVFACVRVHTLVRSPAFTAERTAFFSNSVVCLFQMQKCVRNEHSE